MNCLPHELDRKGDIMILRVYIEDELKDVDYYDIEFDNETELDLYITTKLPQNCVGWRVFSSQREADKIERGIL